MSLEIMFENLCSGLIKSISEDTLCFPNQTALSLPSKPLLNVYSCLWHAAQLPNVSTPHQRAYCRRSSVTPCCTQKPVGERKVLTYRTFFFV